MKEFIEKNEGAEMAALGQETDYKKSVMIQMPKKIEAAIGAPSTKTMRSGRFYAVNGHDNSLAWYTCFWPQNGQGSLMATFASVIMKRYP